MHRGSAVAVLADYVLAAGVRARQRKRASERDEAAGAGSEACDGPVGGGALDDVGEKM